MSTYAIDTLKNECYIFNTYCQDLELEVFYGPGAPPTQEKNYAPLVFGLNVALFCFRKTLLFIRQPNFSLGTVTHRYFRRDFYLLPLKKVYAHAKKQTFLVLEKNDVPTLKTLCIVNLINILPGRPNNQEMGILLDELEVPRTLKSEICENKTQVFNIVVDSYFSYLRPCSYCYRKTKKIRKLASHKGPYTFYEGEADNRLTPDEDDVLFMSALCNW